MPAARIAPAASMRAVRPRRSAACLISGEVVTSKVVSGWMRRPSSSPATASISNNDNFELVAGRRIAAEKRVDFGPPDRDRGRCRAGKGDILGGDAGQVKHRHRAKARGSGAKMFERIGARHLLDALDQRHLPVRAAGLADDAADRTPFGEIGGPRRKPKAPGGAAVLVEMVAIA